MVCGRWAVNISHAHGPSIRERGVLLGVDLTKPKGRKPLWSHWLVLPLCPSQCHYLLDHDPDEFLAMSGKTPAQLIDELGERMGVNLWERAVAETKPRMAA
jgi:hypothetical protein